MILALFLLLLNFYRAFSYFLVFHIEKIEFYFSIKFIKKYAH
jgi:hypothetical protein